MLSNDEPMMDVAGAALRVLESCAEVAGEKGVELRLVVGALPPVAISYDSFSSSLRRLLRLALESASDGVVEVQIKADGKSVEAYVRSARVSDRVAFPIAQVMRVGTPVCAA